MKLDHDGVVSSKPLPGISVKPASHSVIVHCHLRWDFVWQRPQQIFSRLAAHHPILFLEDPIGGDGEARLEITEPFANIIRAVPIVPNIQSFTYDTQCEITLTLVKAALRKHSLLRGKFDSPVQWFYSPMSVATFLDQFGAVAVVYDCMDELANFRFAPPEIGERERDLIAAADLVFTGGYRLYEAKSRHHGNTHFFGCGVDAVHFGKATLATTSVPPALAELPRPVLGYFGVIDERLDYPLIKRLAESHPEASVAMVGPFAKVDPELLPNLPNIYWLGQRTYEELPAIVKGFDVCLMPFAMNESTQYINPTKTLEYMAAGKPIVSTAVPDVVRNFTPVVKIAHSDEEFLSAVRLALRHPDPKLIAKGIESAKDSSWDSTVSKMRELMLACIQQPVDDVTLTGSLLAGQAPLATPAASPSSFARDTSANKFNGITL